VAAMLVRSKPFRFSAHMVFVRSIAFARLKRLLSGDFGSIANEDSSFSNDISARMRRGLRLAPTEWGESR
jgi:hypothetical protein